MRNEFSRNNVTPLLIEYVNNEANRQTSIWRERLVDGFALWDKKKNETDGPMGLST